MKKRNILAILAALSAMLFAFAACGDSKKDKDNDEEKKESTSAVAEKTTEESKEDEDALEYIEVTEIVTDAAGETVTNENGEAQTEIVTKPASDNDVTNAPGGNNDTPDKPVNSTDRKFTKLANEFAGKNSFAFDGTIPFDGQNFTVKMYIKGDKIAMETNMSGMTARMIYTSSSVKVIMPTLKCYMTMPAEYMGDMDMSEMTKAFSDIIDSKNLEYVGTTNEKVDGKNYVCETYKDGVNTNKYYFDNNDNLKRIEIIDASGNKNVTKINEFSPNVSDSVFSIPSGYKEITQDNIDSLAGMMGGY